MADSEQTDLVFKRTLELAEEISTGGLCPEVPTAASNGGERGTVAVDQPESKPESAGTEDTSAAAEAAVAAAGETEAEVTVNMTKKKEVAKAAPPVRKLGRPLKEGPRPYKCPAKGCDKTYGTSMGLYQHKRLKHPELINRMDFSASNTNRKFSCPQEGCDKSYDTSAGLYQHKKYKHPEMINRRK